MIENEWYIQIAAKVKASLERKGIVADPKKSEQIYIKSFPKKIDFYGLQTVQGMHPAITVIDSENGKPYICLSPRFKEYSPEFQMLVLIEEAIHVKQLHQLNGNPNSQQQYLAGELDAEIRLLRLKDYLKLSRLTVDLIKNRKANHEVQIREI